MTTVPIPARIAEDTDLLLRHVERHGAFRMLVWSGQDVTDVVVRENVTCFDSLGGVNVLVPEGPDVVVGTLQGVDDGIVAALRQLYADLSQWVEVREPPPTSGEILDAAIAFFEEGEG